MRFNMATKVASTSAACTSVVGNQKPYVGRRTGKVINIVARKNSHGFENVSDYFPNSDSENETTTNEKSQTAITTIHDNNPTSSTGKHGVSESAKNILQSPIPQNSTFHGTRDGIHGGPNDSNKDPSEIRGNEATQSNCPEFNFNGTVLVHESSSEGVKELHSTKKRLNFELIPKSSDLDGKDRGSVTREQLLEDGNRDGDNSEDDYVIIEKPKLKPTPKPSARKANPNKRPVVESDDELVDEGVCKSNNMFLTLNAPLFTVNNTNNSMSISLSSAKPSKSRTSTKSRIPVRKNGTRETSQEPPTKKALSKKSPTREILAQNSRNKNATLKHAWPAKSVSKTSLRKKVHTKRNMLQETIECFDREDETSFDVSQVDPHGEQQELSSPESQETVDEEITEEVEANKENEMTAVTRRGKKKRVSSRSYQRVSRNLSNVSTSGVPSSVKQASDAEDKSIIGSKRKPKKGFEPFSANEKKVKRVAHRKRICYSKTKKVQGRRNNATVEAPDQASTKEKEKNADEVIRDISIESGPMDPVAVNLEKNGDDSLNAKTRPKMADQMNENDESRIKPAKNRGRKTKLESTSMQPTAEVAPTQNEGPRRSQRHRVPALQYWKNERIEYERRKSGWIVKDVITNPTPPVSIRKRKTTSKHPTSRAKKGTSPDNCVWELSPTNVLDGLDEEVDPVGAVINPDTMEEVKMKLVHSSRMLDFRSPVEVDGNEDSAPLLLDKYFSHPQFGSGQVRLRPGAEKGRQHVRVDTMVFHVLSGRVLVSIHSDSFVLARGSSFFVPRGNVYNLKNLDSKKDAYLFFCQIKG